MAEKNEQYLSKAKEILRLMISGGAEAYIVGESLRDILLENDVNEIEIFTSLSKESIKLLFKDYKIAEVDDYTLEVTHLGYQFRISFAQHYAFSSKPRTGTSRRHYSTSLMAFLEQKDYRINSLALGVNNVIYDCYNGREDLNKKRLRMINENPQAIFANNPIKILQGIRLVSELGYKLEGNIMRAMANKAKLLKRTSLYAIATEMKGILEGKFLKKALKVLVKTKVYKKLPFYRYEIKRLYNHFYRVDLDVFLGACLVREKVYEEAIGITSSNEVHFKMLVNLAITNPKGDYDALTLYTSGLELCLKANLINNLLGRQRKKSKQITKEYNALPIKKTCDLAFKGEDILKMTKDNGAAYLPGLIDEIIAMILHGELENDYMKIKEFAGSRLEELRVGQDDLKTTEEERPVDASPYHEDSVEEVHHDIPFDDSEVGDRYQSFLKQQEELSKRVYNLEVTSLQNELEKEIERRIKQSGLLEGLSPAMHDSTRETLRKVYNDILLNDPKYQKLRGEKNE